MCACTQSSCTAALTIWMSSEHARGHEATLTLALCIPTFLGKSNLSKRHNWHNNVVITPNSAC